MKRRSTGADIVVATCDEACPVVPGKRYLSWPLEDPKDQPLDRVRALRNEIAIRVDKLVTDLNSDGVSADGSS
jgi:arsenate reductase